MAALIAEYDWSASLGPVESWPQSLKTTVGLMIHSPVPLVLLWGPDGIMIYNQGYAGFAGNRHPSLLGSKVLEGWPEAAELNTRVMQTCMAGGTLQYKDLELALNRRGQMEPGWMDLFYSPVIDESGKPGGVIAVVVETTERVLAERAAIAQRERLAQMFQDAPSFMCQTDGPEHVFSFTNAAYQQLIAHRDVIGKTVREALPEIAGQGFYELLDQVYASGKAYRGYAVPVTLQRTPDAAPEKRVLDFAYQPVRDSAGMITGIFTEGYDVTESHRSAGALTRSQQRLQLALNAAAMGSFIWDVAEDRAEGDARMMDLFGLKPDGLLSLRTALAESIDPRDAQRYADAVAKAIDPRGDGMLREDIRVRLPNGTTRWLAISGQVAFDRGRPTQMAGAARDITESRDAELRRAALVELGDSIRDVDDPDALAYAAAEILGRVLEVSRAGYGTIDPRAETITIARDWNAPGIKSLAGVLHFRDYGSYIEQLKRGETVLIRDAADDPRTAATADALDAISARSFVNMPVSEDGGLVALLYLNHKMPRVWTDDEVAFIREVAERTRTAVERRRAENTVRQNAERLQIALSAAKSVGTWDWDVRSDRVVADSGFAAQYGVDPARAIAGTPIADFFHGIHPDDVPAVQAAIDIALTRGEPFSSEYRLPQPDGSDKWVIAQGRCTRSADGKPLRFSGISFDITERKNAELRQEALVRLTDRIRDLSNLDDLTFAASTILGETLKVSRVSYGTIDHDAETLTVVRDWLAPGIETLAGTLNLRDYGSFIDSLKAGEFVAISDVENDVRTAGAAGVLKSRAAAAFVNVPVMEKGRLVAVLFLNNASARQWSKEELSLIQEIAERTRTATEKIRATEALREANATLEAKIEERTAELHAASEALRQSQKMEAVGQLTGGIAHDFNNLLQGITGALDRVQHRIAEGRLGDVERFLKAAVDSANRAAALTHRLLAFSRRQTLDPRPTDVNRLIGGMEDLIRRTMGPNVQIEVVGSAGLWPVRVDPSQLENSLLNLCINARDAMPEGGKLTIETANKWLDERAGRERELPPGQYVSLCVTDTGTGMTPDVISRAFDPFFTTKPLGQGTGLGLSMIYGFVRQSGGQIRVYSEIGKGTTMCLYFPRHFGKAEEDSGALSEVVERGFGETVLVVDDEATVRMLVAEVLSENFYNVIEAIDGPSALKALEAGRRIDLMITDVGLPGGMNGRQVADAARVLRPNLKVLFITGYAENAAVANGHLEPGMEILAKPFAMSTLANKVREMIES